MSAPAPVACRPMADGEAPRAADHDVTLAGSEGRIGGALEVRGGTHAALPFVDAA